MSAFSPLSFLCRVLLLIPPSLVVFITGAAAADVMLLSLNFCLFAPSSDCKTVMQLFFVIDGSSVPHLSYKKKEAQLSKDIQTKLF